MNEQVRDAKMFDHVQNLKINYLEKQYLQQINNSSVICFLNYCKQLF